MKIHSEHRFDRKEEDLVELERLGEGGRQAPGVCNEEHEGYEPAESACVHFEPSPEAFSLRSDVTSSIQILSLVRNTTTRLRESSSSG